MIGIYGGTFDPVHLGHLRTVLDVKQALRLEQVRFIPCAKPPHRELPIASIEQRLAMLRIALSNQPDFVLDTREIDRGGISYMIDTLISLKQDLTAPLCLILGMDAFRGFDSWRRYLEIFNYAHIVVMQRPGSTIEELRSLPKVYTLIEQRSAQMSTDLLKCSAGMIWFQPVTQLAVSSTGIRSMCKKGDDVRYLVPDGVRDYIQQHQLYADRGAIAN